MEQTLSQAQKAKGSTRNQTVDLVKLILSVFVVAIHAEIDLGLFTPIFRCAVPTFFLFSGYFYFLKLSRCETKRERRATLWGFVKRNLSLYAFWFTLLLPVTLFIRRAEWLSASFGEGLLAFLRDLFFGSTFRASWFLTALLLGVLIVHALSRVLDARVLVALTLPIYILCCLFTNYFQLAEKIPALTEAYDAYLSVFSAFANSFPAALFWLALANLFAKTDLPKFKTALFCALGGLILLFVEGIAVTRLQLRGEDDCYLALLLLCPAVFCLAMRARPLSIPALPLGAMSTIFYTLHASFITAEAFVLKRIVSEGSPLFSVLLFFSALVFCTLVSLVILRLERFRPLRFLKYSH